MNHSACLVSLWGGKSNEHVVVKHLRSFEAKKKQLFPQVQPLQVTAFETALLADDDVDDEALMLAKVALIRLSSFPCTKTKKRKTTDEECLCDKCVSSKLGYNDFHNSGAFEAQFDMVNDLNFTLRTSQELEKLQEEFFEALLGKELADRVTLRFGTLEKHDDDDPFNETFLYIKDKVEVYQRSLVVLDVHDDDPPTDLEEWAFFKAVTLLGLDTDHFACSNDLEKLVVFLAQPSNPHWH